MTVRELIKALADCDMWADVIVGKGMGTVDLVNVDDDNNCVILSPVRPPAGAS